MQRCSASILNKVGDPILGVLREHNGSCGCKSPRVRAQINEQLISGVFECLPPTL